jgi:CHAT domain-containing protein
VAKRDTLQESLHERKSNQRRFLGFIFLCSFIFFSWLSHVPLMANIATPQTADMSQQVQQGVKSYEAGNFQDAITIWQQALDTYKKANNVKNAAVVSENLARAYRQLGDNKNAIASFDAAINYYGAAKDMRQVGKMLTELAQTYNSQGQIGKAISLLCGDKSNSNQDSNKKQICAANSALEIARANKDSSTEASALGILGEALRSQGNYDRAIQYLEAAKKVPNSGYENLINNSLGNTHANRGQLWYLRAKSAQENESPKAGEFKQSAIADFNKSVEYFQNSLELARKQNNPLGQLQALLNTIQVSYRSHELNLIPQAKSDRVIQEAVTLIDKVPDSQAKVYAAIDLALLSRDYTVTSPIIQCSKTGEPGRLSNTESIEIFNKAISTSKKIQNLRVESYVYGALGHFWECRGDDTQALKYTNQALLAADQKLAAKDGLYLWEWQAGRILKKQNRENESLAAYQRAFNTLEAIRSDIITGSRDVQFDFRDVIQPLYRDLAKSQIQQTLQVLVKSDKSQNNPESGVSSALTTIDSLKLAELQNYFGGDCIVNALNANKVNVDEVINAKNQKNTAVLSSIIFDEGTAMILSLPGNSEQPTTATQIKWVKSGDKILKSEELQKKIKTFQDSLIDGQSKPDNFDNTLGSELYDLMVRPFEDKLNSNKIKTLIFVHDGFLRSIPMSALYDATKREYLIEKYAIGTTPSIKLTASPSERDRIPDKALILGLTKEAEVSTVGTRGTQKFEALKYANREIQAVKKVFPNHKDSIDEKFNPETFGKELGNEIYPVVHIVTHAQFGTIPDDTFIVTGNNDKLTIDKLESNLNSVRERANAIELLALTACETALGDDRATLGLAGVALQVGVKSAIASLWSVQDKSTATLVEDFYRNLQKPGITKSEALQKAQIKMIKERSQFTSPSFWSPFILIGNWV